MYLPAIPPILLRITIPFVAALASTTGRAQNFVQLTGHAQGTSYLITYRPSSHALPHSTFDSIFLSIDKSLSNYNPSSLLSAFNRSSTGVPMDKHLLHIVKASLAFSTASDGAFDITIAPAMTAWGFGSSQIRKIPENKHLDSIRKQIDYKLLQIGNDSLLKKSPLVQIDVNGIAQGYTVDLIAERLSTAGITDYLIELGGEISVKGQNPEGRPWSIGVEWPIVTPFNPSPTGWTFMPDRPGVTTSGVYRNRRAIEERTYTHVIDPRTAKPVDNDIISVTVIAPDAMTADAIDHTCLILGRRRSLRWVSSLPGVDIFIVYRDIRGRIRTQATRGFPKTFFTDGGGQRAIGNDRAPKALPGP